MRPSQGPLARLRPVVAPWLLVCFVAATQVTPAVHLGTHRNDHTHGPAADHDHDDGAVDGAAHEVDEDESPALDWLVALFAGHHHHDGDDDGEDHDHADASGVHQHGAAAPSDDRDHDGAPRDDHGTGSSAHFLLALVDGPPPPFLPAPPETLAAPIDAAVSSAHATPLPQPPARGPPRCA